MQLEACCLLEILEFAGNELIKPLKSLLNGECMKNNMFQICSCFPEERVFNCSKKFLIHAVVCQHLDALRADNCGFAKDCKCLLLYLLIHSSASLCYRSDIFWIVSALLCLSFCCWKIEVNCHFSSGIVVAYFVKLNKKHKKRVITAERRAQHLGKSFKTSFKLPMPPLELEMFLVQYCFEESSLIDYTTIAVSIPQIHLFLGSLSLGLLQRCHRTRTLPQFGSSYFSENDFISSSWCLPNNSFIGVSFFFYFIGHWF